MKLRHVFVLLPFAFIFHNALSQYNPQKDLGELFKQVQLMPVFPDSKTFVDCIPRYPVQIINEKYVKERGRKNFDLKKFVDDNFIVPTQSADIVSSTFPPIEVHIEELWDRLIRQDMPSSGSLVTLPYPYIVPGGRFNEMYYWDSYFTMLGLQVSHKDDLIRNIVNNFSYLIKTYGHIPTGTRTYCLSRSQPPFFSLMIELMAEINGNKELLTYLPYLQTEYNFWMSSSDKLNKNSPAKDRVVLLDDRTILNRYWDNDSTPRPDAYKEDIALAAQVNVKPGVLYRNVRAACESGWDFSTRWFLDGTRMSTIHTTEIIPVDLNCLLYNLEKVLAKAYSATGDKTNSELYMNKAEVRRNAIVEYCWNKETNFFMDYDFTRKKFTGTYSLAGMYPFYFGVAEQEHADKAVILLEKHFLFPGGLLSDLTITGQQWDAPNGWAPLQWITYKGLKDYKHNDLANVIRDRWLKNVRNEYKRTGKLIEKYNVLYPEMPGSGGEYPSQDGFGWTNGIYLKMLTEK